MSKNIKIFFVIEMNLRFLKKIYEEIKKRQP